ncbi:MAG: 50S ribosomal protein L13 [Patescibacteria group bacterium]|jgi:large subunit ribosomal protein L13
MKNIERKVHRLDASGQAVGRLASEIAILLRGKNKPEYQPHLDLGDIVEVVNADQVKFTGRKFEQKNYFSVTGYIGGLKTRKLSEVFAKDPGEVLRRAVKQMLPNNRLRDDMMKRLIIK